MAACCGRVSSRALISLKLLLKLYHMSASIRQEIDGECESRASPYSHLYAYTQELKKRRKKAQNENDLAEEAKICNQLGDLSSQCGERV